MHALKHWDFKFCISAPLAFLSYAILEIMQMCEEINNM